MVPPIGVKTIEALADAKGIEPEKLEITLHEHIDLDAIELLATHETASWTLSFELPNHNVTVTSDGLILVDGGRHAAWA